MNLTKFKKLNEAVSPELLGEDELAKSEDVVLDSEVGRIIKRDGWNKFNSNAIGGTLHSIYDVKADGGNNYIIGGYGTTVKVSADGTGAWGSAISGLSGIAEFQLSPYAGKFYLTDGVIAPKVLGGTTLASTWSLEIARPDVTNTSTGHSASGNLTADTFYRWIIVYVTREGIVSPPSRPISHQISTAVITTTDSTNKCIGFQALPVSSDSRVNARRIYRTTANSDVYYFHSQIDNVVTTWYDDLADSNLGSETFNYLNAPQTAKYSCIHKERLWLANQTRKVKCWVEPMHTKQPLATFTGGFTASVAGSGTKSFTAGVGLNSIAGSADTSTLAAGTYSYRFVFFDLDGIMSDVLDTDTITLGTSNTTKITIPGVPRVSTGYEGVTTGKLYRKFNAEDFKFISDYVINNPLTDRANVIDSGYAVTTSYVSTQTTDTENTGVSFSDVAKPPCFILEDIRDVYPDDGDVITGIFDDIDGVLVFKENSICKIYTNGSPTNWRLVKLVHDVGAKANTIAKSGSQYYFASKSNDVYKFSSGSGVENIGWYIWDTLRAVTSFHSAVTDDSWYVLGISGGNLTSSYGFVVYDLMTQSWYRFNVSAIPYASEIKRHGTSAGELLISNGQYVMYLNGSTDDGTDIVPIVRSKTFGDGISLSRLRKLKFNYKKVDGKTTTITIVNPDTAVTNTYSDTTNSTNASDFKLYESPVKDTDSLKETSKFYIQITGAGLSELADFRLDLRPIHRGKQVGN